ncbi:FGGY family carbohydrate kinase [Alkalitalea saponilacus]|uniref:FGGY family carbohydrate kinase n=1 Tax=Alkalitalea saponilacus TaxID=889453 RepID=UPI001E42B4B3|nr:FGGY family carbohydrate kinase [Alkalitalea saponilacus]
MYTLGIDVGSSSVKVSLLNLTNGKCVASAFYPSEEMPILAVKAGWAEQEPLQWWENMKNALADVLKNAAINKAEIKAIGISYQMHGLVALDKNGDVVRPSIIWCDSRAVEIGDKAFKELGSDYCLNSCLNSPGNFTASKLKWVKENEPELYATIDKIMLPGDYIAYRLTGEKQTTVTGLSEGIMWDFKKENVANDLFDYYGFSSDLIPEIVPVFSEQAKVSDTIAAELGIPAGIPVSYRAGDQPNNAFSLNVLEPGEVAATAGTSGVVYCAC